MVQVDKDLFKGVILTSSMAAIGAILIIDLIYTCKEIQERDVCLALLTSSYNKPVLNKFLSKTGY